jgi:hypothetical protein
MALQRRAVNQRGPEIAPPIVHEVLRSSERPLYSETRGFRGPRFDHQFSNVPAHVGRVVFPGSTPMLQRSPSFDADCDEYRRCQVIEALRAAGQLVSRVITELKPVAAGGLLTGRIIGLLNVHFHDPNNVASRADAVLSNFQTLQGQLSAPIPFICAPPAEHCMSSEGQVGAFNEMCSLGSAISLCPVYYRRPCLERARQLIHELMHSVIGSCQDFAYVHQSGYMTLSPEEAARNPDTYAQFAKMVSLSVPICRDCAYEAQVHPGQY